MRTFKDNNRNIETFAHYGVYLLYVKNVLTGTRHKQVKVKLASCEFSIVLITDNHIQVEYTKRGADFTDKDHLRFTWLNENQSHVGFFYFRVIITLLLIHPPPLLVKMARRGGMAD